jgi:hypothetical protein
MGAGMHGYNGINPEKTYKGKTRKVLETASY